MQHDAMIIGGSFAGLSAAMQLARGGRKVGVIDAGEPRSRFAAASHGFFGRDGAPPLEMIAEARSKLLHYPSVTFVQGQAVEARRDADRFSVVLASGERLAAAKLVMAFGVVDVLPDIPGMAERWGRTVLHCPYCHGYEFSGKPLGVLSLGPISVLQALVVADWGPTTFFLNGGPPPDAATAAKLAKRGVKVEPETIEGLEGNAPDHLAGVRLSDGRTVGIVALYLSSRTEMASPLGEQLGCAFDDGHFGPVIRTDTDKMTTIPGVYAAGDIARPAHNASWAAADGVTAGIALHHALIFEPLGA